MIQRFSDACQCSKPVRKLSKLLYVRFCRNNFLLWPIALCWGQCQRQSVSAVHNDNIMYEIQVEIKQWNSIKAALTIRLAASFCLLSSAWYETWLACLTWTLNTGLIVRNTMLPIKAQWSHLNSEILHLSLLNSRLFSFGYTLAYTFTINIHFKTYTFINPKSAESVLLRIFKEGHQR